MRYILYDLLFEGLAKLMLWIVYGSKWKDRLETMKTWIPPVLAISLVIWMLFLLFIMIGSEKDVQICFPYAVLYPIAIGVWTIHARTRP